MGQCKTTLDCLKNLFSFQCQVYFTKYNLLMCTPLQWNTVYKFHWCTLQVDWGGLKQGEILVGFIGLLFSFSRHNHYIASQPNWNLTGHGMQFAGKICVEACPQARFYLVWGLQRSFAPNMTVGAFKLDSTSHVHVIGFHKLPEASIREVEIDVYLNVNVWMWGHGHTLEANLKAMLSGLFLTSEHQLEHMTSYYTGTHINVGI